MNREISERINAVIHEVGVDSTKLLGSGAESYVFEYETNFILKIHLKSSFEEVLGLKTLYELIRNCDLSYNTPLIIKVDEKSGLVFSIEEKLPGVGITSFKGISTESKSIILKSYYDALDELKKVNLFDKEPYGGIISKNRMLSKEWSGFLLSMVNKRLPKCKSQLQRDTEGFEVVLQRLLTSLGKLNNPRRVIVHNDFYLENLLFTENHKVESLLDFSDHSCIGDHLLDIVGGISYLTLVDGFTKNDLKFVFDLAQRSYGDRLFEVKDVYEKYLAIYYADSYEFDKKLYSWCCGLLSK